MEIANTEAEAGGGLEAAAWGVHANGGWREGIVRREHQCAPVLSILVWGLWRACEDVMPSASGILLATLPRIELGFYLSHSKMLDSEGWATIYGGGFF